MKEDKNYISVSTYIVHDIHLLAVKQWGILFLVKEDDLDGGDNDGDHDDSHDSGADPKVFFDLVFFLYKWCGVLI